MVKKQRSIRQRNLEGVISSETANNAATGAAMIPLLALGLPGGFNSHNGSSVSIPRHGAWPAGLLQLSRTNLGGFCSDVLRQRIYSFYRPYRNKNYFAAAADTISFLSANDFNAI